MREAALRRRSYSAVTDEAPSHEELADIVRAASRVADHGSLRPWRILEIRGDSRTLVGRALAKAAGDDGISSKPLRAPLLLAVVASRRPSAKAPAWEQDTTASGVAHLLTLLLDEAGWGVFWRTGEYTRSKPVRKAHGLAGHEELLGWLYVGGIREKDRLDRPRRPADPDDVLSLL